MLSFSANRYFLKLKQDSLNFFSILFEKLFDITNDNIRNAIDQDGLANDGTRGYDLLELAKMIENGEF